MRGRSGKGGREPYEEGIEGRNRKRRCVRERVGEGEVCSQFLHRRERGG